MVTTADQREIDNFAALSDQWWDMRGPMAPLHDFTPIRIDYILANIERFWPKKARPAAPASRPLTGLRILDIGCGGGLLAEPMARLGATVTGIDVTEAAIIAAATHAKQADAPELAKNVNLLMWYPYGAYHFAVRADSDIQTLDDIEGASVFLGPQGGGAFNAAKGWVASTTGLVEGEDYEAIKANWQTGYQAFLDGKIDVYVNGCLDPCGQFIQFTETEEVRFIAPEDHTGEAVEKFLGKFRYYAEVPAGVYEGQKNDGPVMSFDTAVGIAVRADMDEETVYKVTKAFWDNIDQVTSEAPWAKALNLEFAASKRGLAELHPGAARYYREVGVLK